MFKKKPKNKKILKVKPPLISVYPHIAGVFAIFENNPYTLPLLVSELSELTYDKEIDRLDFSLALEIEQYMNNYPLVYSHGISRRFVEMKWKDAASFIKDAIDEGYYIHMLLDTYYVRAYRETYGKQHFNHNIMLYGYDEEQRVFYGADCFVNGRYGFETCTFEEIENAFLHSYKNDWINGIKLIKLKEEPYVGIGYNTDYIVEACRRYLAGEKSNVATYAEGRRRYDMKDRFVDGINIYDELISYVSDDCGDGQWNSYDIRMFYVLYDHIKLFRYMTKQLMQRNQMINAPRIYRAFYDIENRVENLYMQVLKYNVTGSEKLKSGIVKALEELKEKEENAIIDFTNNVNASKEDIKSERALLVRTSEITPDSIYVEFDEEKNWKKKSLSENIIYTDVSCAYMKTQFYGNGADIRVFKKETYGQANVYVDDEKCGNIDYADSVEENVYHIQGLKNGYHILKIENVSENGRTINFGGIDISTSQEDVVNNGRLTACEKGTGADYIKKCKNTGYDIICARKRLPEYLTEMGYVIHNAINVLLISDNADERGVKKYAESVEKVAGYALSDTEFWVELTIPGAVKKISFYSVDYDYLGREMEVCVEDADTGRVLCTKEIKEFQEGVLLTFELRGHIFVRYRNVKGPDAVLNAVWFW